MALFICPSGSGFKVLRVCDQKLVITYLLTVFPDMSIRPARIIASDDLSQLGAGTLLQGHAKIIHKTIRSLFSPTPSVLNDQLVILCPLTNMPVQLISA
jgi:hypothetical protein